MRSVLCLNGTLPGAIQFQQIAHLPMFAADGAAHRLLTMGQVPSWIVGDGDSLGEDPLPSSCHVDVDSDQETCDFEKCLRIIEEESMFPALVFGIGGGELDHQHHNLEVFMRESLRHPMMFVDWQEGFPTVLGLAVRESLTMQVQKGSHVSLLPFPKATVRTEGLQWSLHDEVLEMFKRSGARNHSSENIVRVHVREGLLLVTAQLDAVASLQLGHLVIDPEILMRLKNSGESHPKTAHPHRA